VARAYLGKERVDSKSKKGKSWKKKGKKQARKTVNSKNTCLKGSSVGALWLKAQLQKNMVATIHWDVKKRYAKGFLRGKFETIEECSCTSH